jgi:DNA-binding CsgD family transcriptional regulator/tetratricopeptide (TPR) repeat protein
VAVRIASPRIVARDAERAALAQLVSRAGAGAGAVALVAGEAGIGKSRLVADTEARARAEGAIVLHGDCVQLDGGELPYAPLGAALLDAPPEPLARALAQLGAEARAELACAFPQLGAGEPASETPAATRFSQARLYEFLLQLLAGLGRQSPVLLVIEDLHWVDRSTSDFVRFMVRRLRDLRLAAILTYRTGELDRAHPVRQMVADLRLLDRVTWLDLEPLPEAAVEAQLAAILGQPPPAGLVAEVYGRCGGNPLFAEELLAAGAHERPELPDSLADALLARVRRLSEPAQELLRVLTVIGRPVDERLPGAVLGQPATTRARALREALDQHVVTHVRQDATFAFRHEILREAIYADLLPVERAALHAAVAESLGAIAPPPPAAAELAFHWRAAGRRAEAFEASLQAGRQAEGARAFAEALRHFEQALELWDDAAPPELDRLETLGRASDLARHAGYYDRATALCEEGLARLGPDGDGGRLAAFYERLGRLQSFSDDGGLGAFQEALRRLPADDGVGRARLLGAEGYALWALGRLDEATARCEAALALATGVGAVGEAAYAQMVLGLTVAHAGDPERGEAHLREALKRIPVQERPDTLLYGHIYLGEVLRLRGEFDAAEQTMAQGEALARQHGMEAAFGRFMALNAANDRYLLGRWSEAEQALASLAGAPLEDWDGLVLHQVAGQLHLAHADLDAAAAELEQACAMCDGAPPVCVPAVFAALTELDLARGEPERACARADEGLAALGEEADALYAPALYAAAVRARADLAAGAAPDARTAAAAGARDLVARLETLLAEHAAAHRPPTAEAYLAGARAELARAEGAAAAEAWAAAAGAWDRLRAPYPAAYARWRQAEAALLVDNDRAAALELLGRVDAVADRLGARVLQGEVEGLARRGRIPLHAEATGEPAEAADPSPGDGLGLTARELEVLALLGEGMTNRQIGETLFISPKTAGLHVSHILAKLDVANRTQAADIAHRRGLVRRV